MSTIGQPERATQNRVIALFTDGLAYAYLGDWTDRTGNSNVEEVHLGRNLKRRGYTQPQVSRALHILRTEADTRLPPFARRRTSRRLARTLALQSGTRRSF